MNFPPIYQLGAVTVEDSNIPGKERIVFRPTDTINLVQCGLFIGAVREDSLIVPLNNEFYWFGDLTLTPPAWVVVYTGIGRPTVGTHEGSPVYFRYWGKKSTVFTVREVVPLLMKFSAIQFGTHTRSDLPKFKDVMKQIAQGTTQL